MKKQNTKSSDQGLKPLVEYLDSHVDEESLTSDLVSSRAELVSTRGLPGWIVFDIEQSRPALGPVYRGGRPVAMLTARQRYAFHPVKKTLVEIGTIGKPDLDCDVETLAKREVENLSFSCKRQEDGSILCSEACFNESAVIASAEDAEAFGWQVVQDWTFEGVFFESYGVDCAAEVSRAFVELGECCAKLAGEAACKAWEEIHGEVLA